MNAVRSAPFKLLVEASLFERTHPISQALAHGLGHTAAQVDDLWCSAAAL